jgi:hypothetical protein
MGKQGLSNPDAVTAGRVRSEFTRKCALKWMILTPLSSYVMLDPCSTIVGR